MLRGVRVRLLVGALMALFLVPVADAGGAECQDCLGLELARPETGWIRITLHATDPVKATLSEQVGDQREPVAAIDLPARATPVVVRHASRWRCDRYARTFVVVATFPDGVTQTATAAIKTPSCKHRLTLSASARRGRVTVRLADRFGVGDVPARACVAAPGRKLVCRPVRIGAGHKQAKLTYRARSPGLWSVELQTAWKQAATARVYVRPSRPLRLLATGDSMIEYVDSSLKQRLGRRGFKVRSDPRVSTGLSKPFLLNWPRLAKRQASKLRPDITVAFIGANDGFPFGSIDCCGDAWVNAYASRAEAMMRAYSRQGHGLVYWLTLPAPRPAQWRPIYPAVNRALKRAAARFAGRVRIVDIAKVLTPGFRFRSTMVWQGHRQTVRQADGVHLSPAGASIAEVLIQRALARDGVIG
ncbi:MAG: uncharacterized protein QOH13_853 [Thermoleophilaceae bacterium]|nr:uncharacterized protein [Thermoleophilaceae bacterium]